MNKAHTYKDAYLPNGTLITSSLITFYLPLEQAEKNNKLVPYFSASVSAGFPSPADDYLESKLNITSYLIKHPAATFFLWVKDNSASSLNIYKGDLLIVDKSLKPRLGHVVIANLEGTFSILQLNSSNYSKKDKYPTAYYPRENSIIVGVATAVIHSLP